MARHWVRSRITSWPRVAGRGRLPTEMACGKRSKTNRESGDQQTTQPMLDRKSTRLNSSHTVISPLSLHDALPIFVARDPLEQIAVGELRTGLGGDGAPLGQVAHHLVATRRGTGQAPHGNGLREAVEDEPRERRPADDPADV